MRGVNRARAGRAALPLALLVLVVLMVTGCQEAPPPPAPEPEPVRVENPELGIVLNDVAPFELVESNEEEIELAYAHGDGTLRIFIPDLGAGVNLVASVEEHKAGIQERESGEYKGGQELMVPHLPSAVYYSRGRYADEAGNAVEETAVFFLHPLDSTRQLRLVYTYPAGEDSKERLQDQLFAVLGELEGWSGGPEAGGPAVDAEQDGS